MGTGTGTGGGIGGGTTGGGAVGMRGTGTGMSTMQMSRRERQMLTDQDSISFRPACVTCFGDYVLAYLISNSRRNYLALWGPSATSTLSPHTITDA